VLYVIAMGKARFDLAGGFASDGYGAHSPGGYSLAACVPDDHSGRRPGKSVRDCPVAPITASGHGVLTLPLSEITI
jgi:hypothetical protein